MKIVNLIQGSPEWKAWRFHGITASDISILMGSNSYKSIHDLWVEKLSQIDSTISNVAMQHGSNQEPYARIWIEALKNTNLVPHCVVNDTNEVYRCSLDGYDEKTGEVYEIKCPYSSRKVLDARVFDQIDLAWVHQVQWQLLVTGSKKGYIAVWDSNLQSCHFISVVADPILHEEMKTKADEFWNQVLTLQEPSLDKNELITNNDESYFHLCKRYEEVKDQMKKLSEEESHLKALITKDNVSFRCFNYKIMERQGGVTYDTKLMQADGIDLSLYTKPRASFFVITKEKNRI